MNTEKQQPENWLRGPIPEIPDVLQPAAHALLQSLEEIKIYTKDFPIALLDEKPAGRASVAFHLKHITGVLDRMLTYAKEEPLSKKQFDYLKNEQNTAENSTFEGFINAFEEKVNEAFAYFRKLNPENLTDSRSVGRKKLPSTLIGLLFHAAEHSQRHVGQLLVTVSVLKELER
ncbi:MAG TPA: DinB family protein [Leeuwenhoekiella sp.]|nr:DinB family protein [Leeuwenhoekiella sp.]